MTSPLAWMPIAIIIFGVGNKPIYFLITVAAVWPIIINTAHGVRNVNVIWIKVVRMLGGHDWEVLRRAVIPAIIPDVLTGLRISLGISWIILVPAEMLGVPSGLGYYILDTRDRFNYGEMTAVILVIGFLGFISDTLLRIIQTRFSWRKDMEHNSML
jgi:NitT/TauT family transport system permease protein